MLRQNSPQTTPRVGQEPDLQTLSDLESLRAAYRAVTASAAQAAKPRPFPMEQTFARFTDGTVASAVARRHATRGGDEFFFPKFNQPKPAVASNVRPSEFSRQARENRPALKTAAFDFEDEPFQALPPPPESLLVKLLDNPKPVMLVIGFCLLSSAMYAGLGGWWLASRHTAQAAEPVAMMAVQDAQDGEATENGTTSAKQDGLGHIHALQGQQPQSAIIVPKESGPEADPANGDLPGTLLAQATSSRAPAAPENHPAKLAAPELTGRPDPFAPLVQVNGAISGATATTTEPQKKDVLQEMQYTGFIGNINAKNKLAVIKIFDPSGGGAAKTLIKKAGDAFTVDGERVVLRGIAKQSLQLSVAGQARVLRLVPYQETVASASTGSAGSSAAPGGATPPAGQAGAAAGASASAPLGNLNALSNGSGSEAPSPNLREAEYP
jgi:hypothetical protein